MKQVRGVVSLTLSLTLVCLNVEAATMHVHHGGGDAAHHHDGPAFHDHEATTVPTADEIGPADDDGAIHFALTSCPPSSHQQFVALAARIGTSMSDRPQRQTHQESTARAHGPPPGASCSLRAPPRSTHA